MPRAIFTARIGRNSDLFKDILRLYVPNGCKIADVTYGKGLFWKKIPENRYQLETSDIKTGTDLKNLPYSPQSFDALVLDPPYAHNSTAPLTFDITERYNLNSVVGRIQIRELYTTGAREAMRVLKDNAIFIIKCQDEVEGGKQIWNHINLIKQIEDLGFECIDLFVLIQESVPVLRFKHQIHARKNHSYFLVFKKGKGLRSNGFKNPDKTLLEFGN